MTRYSYRPSNTNDPEERLEDAALWKALHDLHGDNITIIDQKADPLPDTVFFGRVKKAESLLGVISGVGIAQPQYWDDPAFLRSCGREFSVHDLEGAKAEVQRLQQSGKNAFVKSLRPKYFTSLIPDDESLSDVLGPMEFSFCDDGECLMVQEAIDMIYETRFLFVDGELVTSSPVAWHLTPIDRLEFGDLFETPRSKELVFDRKSALAMMDLAKQVASEAETNTVCIDCAIDSHTGGPIVIEFNPLHYGNVGLYACDVRAIARSTLNPVFEVNVKEAKTFTKKNYKDESFVDFDDTDDAADPLGNEFGFLKLKP